MLAPPHVLLPALLLVALVPALALDNPGESCRQAAGEFEGAKTDLQARCCRTMRNASPPAGVGDSCTAQFGGVDLAQERLENAVADYESACR